jgi:hypothetical protein
MVTFLLNPWARAVAAVGGVFVIWFAFASHYEGKGARKVIAASKIEGAKNAEKSAQHHSAARKPGAAERLLKDSCRDC